MPAPSRPKAGELPKLVAGRSCASAALAETLGARGALVLAVPLVVLCFAAGYYYVTFARLIDARLHGERDRVLPRVFARPLELRRGQSLTERQLVDRLNDLGYAQRARADKARRVRDRQRRGRHHAARAELKGQAGPRRRSRSRPAPPATSATGRRQRRKPRRITSNASSSARSASDRVTLDAPVLTSLISGEREKRRPVALSAIPAADGAGRARDRGSPLLRASGRRSDRHRRRVFCELCAATRAYLAGGSTITQQLVRNVFLPKFEGMTLQRRARRSLRRKLLEAVRVARPRRAARRRTRSSSCT